MSEMNRAVLRKELIRDEGERLTAYRDSVGLWTIGVGHLLGQDPRMTQITKEESRALLNYDIEIAESRLTMIYPMASGLDDVRHRAMVNMTFNLGGRLSGFKNFLAAMLQEDWLAAGQAMAASKWAGQVGERAHRLRRMIETGEVGV